MNGNQYQISDESQLITRLTQMSELLELERGAIISADTQALETLANKKQKLTNILANVSPELLSALGSGHSPTGITNRTEIKSLIAQSSARNSINGSMLAQAKRMTEKSIGILLTCTDKDPVELYDEQGKLPEPGKKRQLGAA